MNSSVSVYSVSMNSSVSVIIPAHNAEAYLADAIKSVLAQTTPPNEIIVVDDGSTDRTSDVARSFGRQVCYLHQSNAGPAAARNRGVAEARSGWVAFLDADDVWFPTKLEVQLNMLRTLPAKSVLCSDRLIFEGIVPSPTKHIDDPIPHKQLRVQNMIFRSTVATSSVLAPKDEILNAGGFDPRFPVAEDYALWLKLASRLPFIQVCSPLVAYRVTPTGLSQNLERMRDNELRVLEDFLASSHLDSTLPKRMTRKLRACLHLRTGIAFAEVHEWQIAVKETVCSILLWPFSLPEYSRGCRFFRLRFFRRLARDYCQAHVREINIRPSSTA